MSFQRTNLHLSVSSKPSSIAEINFRGLILKAQQAHAAGRRLEPTLVYVQTKKEADEVHGVLLQAGVAAAK
jgi:superfamily II DNA helicase RecQ